jgi:hypothetical protein
MNASLLRRPVLIDARPFLTKAEGVHRRRGNDANRKILSDI